MTTKKQPAKKSPVKKTPVKKTPVTSVPQKREDGRGGGRGKKEKH